MKTFDELFSAFSEDNGGENLEYDAAFLALQQAVVEKPEQQFGETIIDAQAPDWNQVEKQALALCSRTCDLRVIHALTCAWTSQNGLVGYASGIRLAQDALQQCWDGVYPQLVEDDYEDPLPRINALNSYADMLGVGRSVRSANVLTGAHGQLALRDAESIMEGSRADLFPGGRARLVETLNQAAIAGAPEIGGLANAAKSLQDIVDLVTQRLGTEWAPSVSSLQRSFELITNVLGASTAASASSPDEAASNSNGSGDPLESSAGDVVTSSQQHMTERSVSWTEVQIKTRDEAMVALEKVSSYFEIHEPSHPAPFLIRRVQQTIPLNFHEMLKNLTPGNAEQFETWLPREE
ncbi:protein ImpA [Advenella sp. S44]|uniref:type VI secretion system protein TssA n=1 Tax=Advenella sp. S44 TaxID=1982755 RepID=UPI000C2AE19B|nr:type VI secretion system protein TssA [Advenella sp. S44]PJX27655.1 protein ImpA [Advenella sp. S44]